MTKLLPRSVIVRKLADQRAHLAGSLYSEKYQTEINAVLQFNIDTRGFCSVNVQVEHLFEFKCQRCLKPLTETVQIDSWVSPVKTDAEARLLPDEYEPILVDDDGELTILTLIEQEMLLSLPNFPKHDGCKLSINQPEIPKNEKKKPFAHLKTWIDAQK